MDHAKDVLLQQELLMTSDQDFRLFHDERMRQKELFRFFFAQNKRCHQHLVWFRTGVFKPVPGTPSTAHFGCLHYQTPNTGLAVSANELS